MAAFRVPLPSLAVDAALSRLDDEWETYQTSRNRDGIHRYLSAVFDLIAVWESEGAGRKNAGRALWLRGYRGLRRMPNPFTALITVTSNADHKARSKWSRVLRYALEHKSNSEPLGAFIRRKGGINTCAARYTRDAARQKTLRRRAGLSKSRM
jgi:hypothetical protein